jgi:hypothetical protein
LLAGVRSLAACGAGAVCRKNLRLHGVVAQSISDALNDAEAICGSSASIRVIEQDCAAH